MKALASRCAPDSDTLEAIAESATPALSGALSRLRSYTREQFAHPEVVQAISLISFMS
jgi:hypothetical protein